MAKLNKIRFARVVAHICEATKNSLSDNDIKGLDDLIDIDTPVMGVEPINEMLDAISQNKKIDAIKHYRAMTGANLIDAKRAIELVLK